MGTGNSFRYEGPASQAAEAVAVVVNQDVIDEYNQRIMEHLAAHPISSGNHRYSRFDYRYDESEDVAAPKEGPEGHYPKLLGDRVMMLPFDGGPALTPAQVAPVRRQLSQNRWMQHGIYR
ncbi:MAG: hypothetical protein QG553_459 [Patescibacteria group bacterium]|nr:hypothetical protein [Patescibacteria group bacterium]